VEVFFERLLLELLFIAIQIMAIRVFQWLRGRIRDGSTTPVVPAAV
jgi:hypothetical protein